MCSSNGFPSIGIIDFGTNTLRGQALVPFPPALIIAFNTLVIFYVGLKSFMAISKLNHDKSEIIHIL